jgi:hypothetical protein
MPTPVQQKFAAALDALIAQVKHDRSILAALLCGSLSHDTVWEKSDIDLIFVTVDDRKAPESSLALNADGVNVHAMMIPRTQFRKLVDGSVRQSFTHSFLAKGRLLYTHDPTIEDLCRDLGGIGARDARVQLLRAATHALPAIDKAHKWMVTRGDLDYTALWILYAATPLAQIEVVHAGRLADREVIPQALKLNPAFFKMIYTDLLNAKKTRNAVQAALDAVDAYVADRADALFGLVIDYLKEVGEPRSATELETHFKNHFDLGGVVGACEYLSDTGAIAKVSTPVRLTKISNVQVQEQAFVLLGDGPGGPDHRWR